MASPPAPRFRLLLHGQDGAIPYLTPELTRLVFCPSDDGGDDGGHWEWRRRHFILGVAVKDTCVTPVYKEKPPPKRKRKSAGAGSDRPEKRSKEEEQTGASTSDVARVDSPATSTSSDRSVGATTASPNGGKSSNDGKSNKTGKSAKKPSGYTFLTHQQSSQICTEINSHRAADRNDATNYMQTHLRIPRYISTMIVPTFSLDYPEMNDDSEKSGIDGDESKKKHVQKEQSAKQPAKKKQKQQPQKATVIPNSTKDSMPVDTPHGWQRIGPEQYCDAVLSLTLPTSSKSDTSPRSEIASCEGAVGLFDHVGMDREQANRLFASYVKDKDNREGDDVVMTPEAEKAGSGKWYTSVQRLVQRTNEWSCRSQCYYDQKDDSSIDFWTPVHLAASHLPLEALFASPRPSSMQRNGTNADAPPRQHCDDSKVAIVGWDSVSCSREHRQKALRNLMATLQSSPTPPKQHLVLSVNDLPSILDAAKAGVSIIGTDVVRQWSRGGKALCLDLVPKSNEDSTTDASIVDGTRDLRDEWYARDSRPLLSGCKCITCRPRRKSTSGRKSSGGDTVTVPSFTRAYVHHLLKAKEMLAETLLFLHNLHQMLLLFRQLGWAAGSESHLEAFCEWIEEQL